MTTALLVIDMQQGMADRIAAGRQPVNPGAIAKMSALMARFRAAGLPVVHVHHDDADPASPFRRDAPGGGTMPETAPVTGEEVVWKRGSSGFAGTGLERALRTKGIDTLAIIGAVAGFCVTSTVRAASDLGFRVLLPQDALLGFDLPAHDGGRIDAETVHRVTLSLLGADFATILRAADLPR
ncbi:MAG: cysteine hydrolase family protein [Paracoccaceae bacterium]